MDRKITLAINGQDIRFTCTADDFDRFTNEVEPKNKVAGMHNLLLRAVDPEDKEALKEVLKRPGATALVFSEVFTEATSDLQITVKK